MEKYRYNAEYDFYTRDEYDDRILYESKNYLPLFGGLNPGFKVLDIGAHIGTFTRLAALNGSNYAMCYEPYHPSYSLLCHNLKRLPLDYTALNYAIGRGVSATLSVFDNTSNNSIHRKSDNTVGVKVHDFNAAVMSRNYTVVKVDIEGAEYSIDFAQLPAYVKRVAIEMHTCSDIAKLHASILDLGFIPLDVDIDKYIKSGRCVLGLYKR